MECFLSEPIINLKSVTKTYGKGAAEIVALDNVNLTIRQGEMVAIVGSSGSGKSTMLNVLSGMDAATKGEIVVNSKHLNSLDGRQLAEFRNTTIGFVFQQFHLLPRKTALDNVRLPLLYRHTHSKSSKVRAMESLKLVGLSERSTHKPNELSGGQQQRVAIARALVGNPKILLADEPTGSLDSSTSGEILDVLKDLNSKGITVVIITHDQEVSNQAKRVVSLRDGRIVSDISHGELA